MALSSSVREDAPAYNPMRVVVSFGPEHAPLEQRQVASALEEAQTLVPRPKRSRCLLRRASIGASPSRSWTTGASRA